MDATDTVPYEPTPQALEDSRDIIISAPSGKPQVCRCKTLELGDASASPDVCTCAVSRMSGDQPSTAETADIGGSKEAAASDAKPEVGGSQAAPGAPVTSMAAAPLDPTKHQPAHESNGDDKPRVEAAQEDVNSILQPQSNKTEEVLEEPPKEPTDEAIPIAPPDVEPSAPAATNAPEQEVDPVPEVAPAEEPEAQSPNKAPLDADDERRYLELQDAAEMHAAKARLDAQEGIVNEAEGALKEDARSPKPVDKNLKVNGYVLPKEWLQLPYITPQEQTTADGSEAKKRGRKPKAKPQPSTEEPARGRSSKSTKPSGRKVAALQEEAEASAKPSRKRKVREEDASVAHRRDKQDDVEHEVQRENASSTRKRRSRRSQDEDGTGGELARPSKKGRCHRGRATLAKVSKNKQRKQQRGKEEEEELEEPRGRATRKRKASQQAATGSKAVEPGGGKRKRQQEEQEASSEPAKSKEQREKAALRSRKCVAYAKAKRDMIAEGYEPTDPKVIAAGKKVPWLAWCFSECCKAYADTK